MSEPPESRELAERMAAGAAWTITLRLLLRLVGIVSTVILARLLIPADFGLVALAALVAAALELLTGLDFRVWLIRHPAATREHYDTVWTLSILRGTATCLAMLLLAYPTAAFFNEQRLASVMLIMATVAFASGVGNVGIVDFQKHLAFDRDFRLTLSARLGAFVVSIGMAWWLRDYRALVGGMVAAPLLQLVLSYSMHSYRPRLSLACWRETFNFSKWLLAGDALLFLYSRADNFILGKLASTGALGVYTLAHEIASLASTELVMPIRRVLIPGYAKMLEDRETLRQAFVDGFAIILLLGLPIAAGLGLVADPLVRVAVGEQWLASIPLLQVLAIYGMTSVASANLGPVLIPLGYTRIIAFLVGIGFMVLVPLFIWSYTMYGILGGTWAVAITDALVLGIGPAVTLRTLELPVTRLLKPTWRTLTATLAMTGTVLATQSALRDTPTSVQLLASIGIGAVSYVLTTLAL